MRASPRGLPGPCARLSASWGQPGSRASPAEPCRAALGGSGADDQEPLPPPPRWGDFGIMAERGASRGARGAPRRWLCLPPLLQRWRRRWAASRHQQPGEAGRGGPVHGHGRALSGWQLSECFFYKTCVPPKPVRKGRLERLCRWPRLRVERSSSVYFALWSQGPRLRSGAPWGGCGKKAQQTCMGVSGLTLAATGAGQPWADSSVLPLGLEPPRPSGSGSQRVVLTAGVLGGSLCPDARMSAGCRSEGQSCPLDHVLSCSGRAVLTRRWQGGSGEDIGSPRQG